MEERYGFKPPMYPQVPSAPYPTYPPPSESGFPPVPPYPNQNTPYPPQPSGIVHATLPNPWQSHQVPPSSSLQQQAFRWVETSNYGSIPSTALKGGVDVDGQQIYIGRAYFEGDWIPAKVIPGRNVAYVGYNGEEHAVDRYEVLCEQIFDWVPTSGGNIPFGAVQGGQTRDGEPLYIGRAYHEGSQTVGKIHPSHSCCYIPFDGKEVSYSDYECLIFRS